MLCINKINYRKKHLYVIKLFYFTIYLFVDILDFYLKKISYVKFFTVVPIFRIPRIYSKIIKCMYEVYYNILDTNIYINYIAIIMLNSIIL